MLDLLPSLTQNPSVMSLTVYGLDAVKVYSQLIEKSIDNVTLNCIESTTLAASGSKQLQSPHYDRLKVAPPGRAGGGCLDRLALEHLAFTPFVGGGQPLEGLSPWPDNTASRRFVIPATTWV